MRRTSQAVREGDWGWSSSFADLDNDGVLDLVQQTGWSQGSAQFRALHGALAIFIR